MMGRTNQHPKIKYNREEKNNEEKNSTKNPASQRANKPNNQKHEKKNTSESNGHDRANKTKQKRQKRERKRKETKTKIMTKGNSIIIKSHLGPSSSVRHRAAAYTSARIITIQTRRTRRAPCRILHLAAIQGLK